MPAGKVEEGEVPIVAMMRELSEEAGFVALSRDAIGFERTLYVRYPDYEFVYHMFRTDAPDGFETVINPEEHQGFRWVTPEEALTMPLIPELDSCIRISFLGGE
ncbi:MAG: NUDIX hydrolase [Candidatus Moranbacteria bacterium]|nr:NUDIX hydrolase [Candidatus Moranbacteria bacterium]NTW45972.1 NUDIX hydrolase [Candidatus Moranbacteria bacterium]